MLQLCPQPRLQDLSVQYLGPVVSWKLCQWWGAVLQVLTRLVCLLEVTISSMPPGGHDIEVSWQSDDAISDVTTEPEICHREMITGQRQQQLQHLRNASLCASRINGPSKLKMARCQSLRPRSTRRLISKIQPESKPRVATTTVADPTVLSNPSRRHEADRETVGDPMLKLYPTQLREYGIFDTDDPFALSSLVWVLRITRRLIIS